MNVKQTVRIRISVNSIDKSMTKEGYQPRTNIIKD
jgi:hypothetical protein